MLAELDRKQEQDTDLKILKAKHRQKLDVYSKPRQELRLKSRYLADVLKKHYEQWGPNSEIPMDASEDNIDSVLYALTDETVLYRDSGTC